MESLDEIQWKSPEFIQERGLNTNNVLEYFSLSPFYDRTSNNQVLMMQFQYQQIQIPPGVSFHQYFQSRLSEMTGIEFVIAYTKEPDFWIIRKQNDRTPEHCDTTRLLHNRSKCLPGTEDLRCVVIETPCKRFVDKELH